MKKINYIFTLALLFSTGLSADDSAQLKRLVELAEKQEQRAQALENTVKVLFMQIIVPQMIKDSQRIWPEGNKNLTQLIEVAGVFFGLKLDEIQALLSGQEVAKGSIANSSASNSSSADDSGYECVAALLDGTH